MNNKIVMMLALCAALTACGKQDTAPAAPAPAPAAESAPAAPAPAPAEQATPAPAPAAASGSIDTSGLPQECVDYVKRFEACTAKMSNAEMRNSMNANLAETVKELQAEEDKSELPGSCKNMTEALTKTPMMESC